MVANSVSPWWRPMPRICSLRECSFWLCHPLTPVLNKKGFKTWNKKIEWNAYSTCRDITRQCGCRQMQSSSPGPDHLDMGPIALCSDHCRHLHNDSQFATSNKPPSHSLPGQNGVNGFVLDITVSSQMFNKVCGWRWCSSAAAVLLKKLFDSTFLFWRHHLSWKSCLQCLLTPSAYRADRSYQSRTSSADNSRREQLNKRTFRQK